MGEHLGNQGVALPVNALQGVAQNRLRAAFSIHLRGVKGVDSVVKIGADDLGAFPVIRFSEVVAAHGPGAQDDGRHSYVAAAKSFRIHWELPFFVFARALRRYSLGLHPKNSRNRLEKWEKFGYPISMAISLML